MHQQASQTRPGRAGHTRRGTAQARITGSPWDHDGRCVSDDSTVQTTRSVSNHHARYTSVAAAAAPSGTLRHTYIDDNDNRLFILSLLATTNIVIVL